MGKRTAYIYEREGDKVQVIESSRALRQSHKHDQVYVKMDYHEEVRDSAPAGCQHCVSCCNPNPVPPEMKLKMEQKWLKEKDAKLYQYFHLRKGGGQSQYGASGLPKQMIIVTDDNLDGNVTMTPNFRRSCKYIKEDYHSLDRRIHAREEKITIDILYQDPKESVCMSNCTHDELGIRGRRGLSKLTNIFVPLKATNVSLMAKIEEVESNVSYGDLYLDENNKSIHSVKDEFASFHSYCLYSNGKSEPKEEMQKSQQSLSWSWPWSTCTPSPSSPESVGKEEAPLRTNQFHSTSTHQFATSQACTESISYMPMEPKSKKRDRKTNQFKGTEVHQVNDVMCNFNQICKQIKTTLRVF